MKEKIVEIIECVNCEDCKTLAECDCAGDKTIHECKAVLILDLVVDWLRDMENPATKAMTTHYLELKQELLSPEATYEMYKDSFLCQPWLKSKEQTINEERQSIIENIRG